VSFPLGDAFSVLCLIDAFGLLRGWNSFGHAAHLGGAAFGYAYSYSGTAIWKRRLEHKLREKERKL
jgi:rhomboid-like protein